jgi:hypothetical protein
MLAIYSMTQPEASTPFSETKKAVIAAALAYVKATYTDPNNRIASVRDVQYDPSQKAWFCWHCVHTKGHGLVPTASGALKIKKGIVTKA